MKRIHILLAAMIFSLLLCGCGGEDKKKEETEKPVDWRNTIEYEGAFFVNEKKRLLYALDQGSITLWDNAGDGSVLQTISYDTSVSDAIERIEKEDFNGDGNRDIRIIYSENEKGTRYNLFLWSNKTGQYAECGTYNTIIDPVYDAEKGTVSGVWDLGVFGKVTKTFAFNANCGLDTKNVKLDSPAKVAQGIADDTVGGTVKAADGQKTVNDVECKVFMVKNGSKSIAYLAYTPDSQWYIDVGCIGLYRCVEDSEGKAVLGKYLGDARIAVSLVETVFEKSAQVTGSSVGVMEDVVAQAYFITLEDGEETAVARDERANWYLYDGEFYIRVNNRTGEQIGDDIYEFSLPSALYD